MTKLQTFFALFYESKFQTWWFYRLEIENECVKRMVVVDVNVMRNHIEIVNNVDC